MDMGLIVHQLFHAQQQRELPLAQLQYLLQQVLIDMSSDAATLFLYHTADRRLDMIAVDGAFEDVDTVRDMVRRAIDRRDDPLLADNPVILDAGALAPLPFMSGMLLPFAAGDDQTAVLALFSLKAAAYGRDQGDQPAVNVIRTLLENYALLNRTALDFATAQSILMTARAIAVNPSPQQVVDLLHDTLFEAHVSSCALLLYGPQRDGPNESFEYLEIQGTWSKRLGSGVGTGVRIYLRDYPDLMEQLETQGVLTYPSVNELKTRFDPLTRGFLRAERIRSLALIALGSGAQKLGVMVIGTDKPHVFEPREIEGYQTVSSFLAMSAMAQVLQQQHDRVQQGRAALLDAVTDSVVMVLPGGAGGSVLTVNKRFTSMFEVPERRAEGATLIDLLKTMQIPEGVREELRSMWLSAPVRDPATQRGEFRMVHRDGHPIDIEWYSAPVYQDSHAMGRIYIFHDVTPERTAQRLRAKFLSSVSHELRTPLTSIRGFAEFILESTGDQLPDIAREYLVIILNSAKHLNRVFNDMIDITRADAGEIKLNKGDANLADIIIDVVARMELQYKARKQQVIMELNDDLPEVNVDIDRISQVLTNLLTNAIKYSPESGTITVSMRYAEAPRDLPDSAPSDIVLPAIVVTVADQGKGLSHEEAERVFMPFFRTEEAKSKKIEGVGLGLAVTRSLVEVHRGKIWAVPKGKNEGGAFVFTVPTPRA